MLQGIDNKQAKELLEEFILVNNNNNTNVTPDIESELDGWYEDVKEEYSDFDAFLRHVDEYMAKEIIDTIGTAMTDQDIRDEFLSQYENPEQEDYIGLTVGFNLFLDDLLYQNRITKKQLNNIIFHL